MSQSGESMTKLWIFILVLNLIFPVLGYTFTSFAEQSENYELTLDADSLMSIGLNLQDGESHNITFDGDWVEYELLNVTIRTQWQAFTVSPDGIVFQKRSTIGHAFDTWAFPYYVDIKSYLSNEWFATLRNDTIIRDFNTEYNWSRFVLADGHHLFVTPFETHGNITQAVWEDGTLNVTLAKSYDEEDTTFNFWRFVGWYTSLLIGDQSWGLPSIFSWVLRILSALSVFAAIMLARRMIPL